MRAFKLSTSKRIALSEDSRCNWAWEGGDGKEEEVKRRG
jgi:hypothetical protein